MRNLLIVLPLALTGLAWSAEGIYQTRTIDGWFYVTTPEGWPGRRYAEGNIIFAEEFDSNGDQRMDIWRFYRQGILISEERDLNGDGKVDYQTKWNPNSRTLTAILRDTRGRGFNDLEISAQPRGRWLIREDRNGDGICDRSLLVQGPPNMFEQLGISLAKDDNIIDRIPMEHWVELEADDGFTGTNTTYWRYTNGLPREKGTWDGKRVIWRRYDPRRDDQPDVAEARRPAPPPATSADPFAAPPETGYPGEYYPPEPQPGDIYTDPNVSTYPEGGYEPPAPMAPLQRNRRRYEGLPPGESTAKSLPAPMRPPGGGRK